jgi:hypothetical protein
MEKRLQDVVEAARGLPLEERVAAARELLATPEEELSDEQLRELEARLADRDSFIPYAEVRRELGLDGHPRALESSSPALNAASGN